MQDLEYENRQISQTASEQKEMLIRGKRVAFLSLGCKVNAYETEAMRQLFEAAGALSAEFEEAADIYVVNTCTVTSIADRKSRQMLHRAKKRNPDAVVMAVGCYVQAAAEQVLADPAVDILVGNRQKNQVVQFAADYLAGRKVEGVTEISREKEYEELSLATVAEKTRAYIKVQDGCNQFCSYCIIPYARGRIRSRKPENVLEEVRRLAAQGYQEIVLTGIHLSSYGFEEYSEKERFALTIPGKPAPLLELVQLLDQVEGISRIRLGSLEPRIITEQFAGELANTKVCPHFHLSLQSGCDATLQRMNRRYDTARYKESCEILRKHFEHPAITTDVIVGFPGETEEEFAATKAFLEEIRFAQMHIFKYSRRHGTKADQMSDQVAEEIKNARSDVLLDLEKKLRREYEAYFVGRTVEVLFEESVLIEGERYMTGHNERYIRFALKTGEDLSNQLISCEVSENFLGGCRMVRKNGRK